jgi:Mg-chelatase subunit ChlD
MRKWQVSVFLVGSAVMAAWLAPVVQADLGPARWTPPEPSWHAAQAIQAGAVSLTVGFDRPCAVPGDRERYLVVDLSADREEGRADLPVEVAVVLDVSGSMGSEGKLKQARTGLTTLVDRLDDHDRFSLTVFDQTAEVVVAPQGMHDREGIQEAIRSLGPRGGTSLAAGLSKGMEVLGSSEHDVRRVMFLSDGLDNSSHETLATLAGSMLQDGVSVSAFGLGVHFDEHKMRTVAEAGGGRYGFVAAASHLPDLIGEELERANGTVAKRAVLELDLGELTLLETYGYQGFDAERTEKGLRVLLGDLHGGGTRKLVLKVELPADHAAPQDLGVAALRWTDPASGQSKVVSAGPSLWPAEPSCIDAALAGRAFEAVAANTMSAAASSWDQGDRVASTEALDKLLVALPSYAATVGDEPVQRLRKTLRKQRKQYHTTELGGGDAKALGLRAQLEALGYISE